MDNSKQESFLKKVEEFVYDEDKIVTSVSLARDLNISLQNAKMLLSKFVAGQQQTKSHELVVTYMLNGIGKNNNYENLCLVKEHDLKHKRNEFDKVFSEVVYSAQKSNDVDFNIIALVEKVDSENPRETCLAGSVVGKNCVKRTLKVKKSPLPQHKPPVKQKPSFFTKIETKSENGSSSNGIAVRESSQKSKQEVKGKAKGGIANFFAKGPQKSDENVATSSSKSNAIKKADKNKAETDSNNEMPPEDTEENKNKVPKVKDMEEAMEIDESSDKETPERVKKNINASVKKNKKKRPNKENSEQMAKKRKRIVQRDDSESDDMFGGDEDNYDDVIEKSFNEELPPSPPPQKVLAPKNKIRKAVDKTYEDEDGFIVTRTEYVYETPSEDEVEEVKVKEKPPPKPAPLEKKLSSTSENDTSPKKNNAAKGKKGKKGALVNQPSIMSFFKKK